MPPRRARSSQSFAFDLLIVDVMMPGEDGLRLHRRACAQTSRIPILLLTAMAEPANRIAGLERGADDYVVKPFEPRELVLRIRNILQRVPRARRAPPAASCASAPFALDLEARRAASRRRAGAAHRRRAGAAAGAGAQAGRAGVARGAVAGGAIAAATLRTRRRADDAAAAQDRDAIRNSRAISRPCAAPAMSSSRIEERCSGLGAPIRLRFASLRVRSNG